MEQGPPYLNDIDRWAKTGSLYSDSEEERKGAEQAENESVDECDVEDEESIRAFIAKYPEVIQPLPPEIEDAVHTAQKVELLIQRIGR